MARNTKGLETYYKKKTEVAINKVNITIDELRKNGRKINFNVVAKESGVAKTFLYENTEIKEKIQTLRNEEVNNEINQRAKFDKTSKSKDVIIQTKDKKIAKLEKEIVELKNHPYFIAGQFHPELKSRPNRPAPLFVGLLRFAKEHKHQ